MRTLLALLLTVAFGGIALAAPPAAATSEQELLALGESLLEAGRQTIANGPDDEFERSLHKQLRVVRYNTDSIETLREILAADDEAAVMLYVAVRLFKPLTFAPTDVAQAGMDLVRSTYDRYDGYEHLPDYSDDDLDAMTPPERDEHESDDSFERRKQRRAERLAEKMVKDRIVQLHNQNLRSLEHQTITMMLEADRSGYDSELIRWMVASEKDRLIRFTWILESIRTAARDMDPDRAAKLYHKLKKYLTRESMADQTYADPSNITIHETQNSTFATEDTSPGEHLLRTINHLATAAELPALLPPNKRRNTGN
jgi:hypothetical protein